MSSILSIEEPRKDRVSTLIGLGYVEKPTSGRSEHLLALNGNAWRIPVRRPLLS